MPLSACTLKNRYRKNDIVVLHIPLIIYDKNLGKKINIDKQVCQLDIAPTIADLANISVKKFCGKSLLKLINNNVSIERNVISEDLHIYKRKKLTSIRTKNWKYILSEWDSEQELYNLKEDPYEKNNLVYKERNLTIELNKLVQNHISLEKKVNKKIEENIIEEVIDDI